MNAVDSSLKFPRAHDGAAEQFRFGRVWSLGEMLRSHAQKYINLGRKIQNATLLFTFISQTENKRLSADEEDNLSSLMKNMRDMCFELELGTAGNLLAKRLGDVPQTYRELELLTDVIQSELGEKLFLFVPSHLSQYYELRLSDDVVSAFPIASAEIESAGNSLSASLFTACVFHSMRAAEIGLRSMHSAFPLTIKSGKPLELADWREVLDALSNVVRDIENRPNADPSKELDQHFVSEASAQFRFFKNGWRVQVAHAREPSMVNRRLLKP